MQNQPRIAMIAQLALELATAPATATARRENGYHAFASLGDNGDGILSGDELRGIQLWQDRNSDGQCTPDELLQLSQLGITALDTRYTTENQIPTSPTGAHFNHNTTRSTYDLVLRRR